MKNKSKMIAQNIAFIDPLGCGSSIGYTIIDRRRLIDGEVRLTDCNRMIQWSFCYDDAIPKIKKAIELLTEFSAALEIALKRKRRRKKRVRS